MENLKQTIANYSNKDIEVRKHWYSPAAEAYNRARPRYPQQLSKLSRSPNFLSSQKFWKWDVAQRQQQHHLLNWVIQ
jgi:hypothetical protein